MEHQPTTPEGSNTTASFEDDPQLVRQSIADIAQRVQSLANEHKKRATMLSQRVRLLKGVKVVLGVVLTAMSGSSVASVSMGSNGAVVLTWLTFILTTLSGVVVGFLQESKILEEMIREQGTASELYRLANKASIYGVCRNVTANKVISLCSRAEMLEGMTSTRPVERISEV